MKSTPVLRQSSSLFSLVILVCLGPNALFAADIVSYDVFGQPGNQATQPATAFEPNTTPSDMVRGGGLLATNAVNSFNSNGWATNAVSTPTVVNTAGYVEIGFDVDAGFAVVPDQLILGSRSSGSGPAQIGVFTSLDGFSSAIHTIDQTAGWPTSGSSGFVNSTIDISSLGNLTGSFRVRFMNVGGDSTADITRAGDMDLESTWRVANHLQPGVGFTATRITGQVIPEPASIVLAMCSISILLWRRG